MAETVDESAFWLPSEFLTDDDIFLMANQKPQPSVLLPPPNGAGIHLFRRSSSALNSPGESVVSSTETESSDDPDEFIAELTRHLAQSALRERAAKPPHHHHHHPQPQPQPQEKSWCALATSPQSTLTGFPGWTNRRPGETRTPPNAPPPAFESNYDDAWELIYAAAERVAKMRMTSQAQMMNQQQSIRRGLLNASSHMEVRTPPVRYNAPQNSQFQQMKSQVKQAWLSQQAQQQVQNRGGNAAIHGLSQSSFPPLRAQQQSNHRHHHLNHACTGGCGVGPGMRAVFLGGSGPTGVKRQSTGTGVFLPRRVGNNTPTEPRKKQGCPTVLLPARVVQALNLNIDEMNGHGHTHTQTQPCLAASNHDILVGRRSAAMATQQRRGLVRGEGPMSHHEIPLLPQEWTY